MNLYRRIRQVEKQTGAAITIEGRYLVAVDPELDGLRATEPLGPPSNHEQAAMNLHEIIYHRRGQAKLKEQGFKCAWCGKALMGTSNTEIDHIETRGSHGRNDRLSNLRILHGIPCHRERHQTA